MGRRRTLGKEVTQAIRPPVDVREFLAIGFRGVAHARPRAVGRHPNHTLNIFLGETLVIQDVKSLHPNARQRRLVRSGGQATPADGGRQI